MAVIRVKRGSTNPTINQLSQVGEVGLNTSTNELFIRGSSSVIKISSDEELVFSYKGLVNSYTLGHTFSNDYIYTVYCLASTNANDLSNTLINYRNVLNGNLGGTNLAVIVSDLYISNQNIAQRNTTAFTVNDAFTNSVASSHITKTIKLEIVPTFQGSLTTTNQWVIEGTSITSTSNNANAPLTYARFVHSVSGTLRNILINPGLDLGAVDTLQISLYRKKRA